MPKATRCRAAVARLRFYQKSKYSVARANLREYKATLNLFSVLRKNAPTKGCGIVAQRRGFAPLAARPAPTLSTSSFSVGFTVIQLPQGKAFCSRKTALLAQSCSLRSVTFTPTYRRSLISSLQDATNVLLNGQLVPRILFYSRTPYQQKKHPRWGVFCLAQRRGFEPPVSFQPTHDFQSCSLNHSDISAFYRLSMRFYTSESHIILLYFHKKGKRFCRVF